MKIGVYDEHLYTAGGGEKHIGGVVEYLSKSHDVTFITKSEVDLNAIGEKLNLDFSRVKVVYWPDAIDEYLDRLTKEYDLFINSTIFSTVYSKAKNGAFLVFFPIVLNYKYPIWLKKLIVTSLGLIFKSRHESYFLVGKHKPQMKLDWRIRENKVGIIFERNIKDLKLEFAEITDTTLEDLVQEVKINNNEVNFKINGLNLQIEQEIKKGDSIEIIFNMDSLKYKNQTEQVYYLEEPYYFRLKYIFFKTTNPFINLILSLLQNDTKAGKIFQKVYGIYVKQRASFRAMNSMKTYKLLMANSKYTQGWIKKMYGLDSEILYPPIDVDKFESGEKENIVMSAGRFFPPKHGHNKKQLEMIQFFKYGYDKYDEFKKYEYHLCGGVKDEKISQDYLQECIGEAKGYPIFIHPNIPFEGLKELYAKAKIFWHASGLGEDDRSPDLFEHFGMTTVESMSAGVVPVVIGKGGQTEIINEGKNGYTWLSKDEAIEKTLSLMKDEELRKDLGSQAEHDSKQYSKENMIESLDKLLENYIK